MIGRFASAAFRLTIHLYPRWFRERYGQEMLRDFAERGKHARDSGGFGAAPGFWVRAVVHSVPSAWRVRWRGPGVKRRDGLARAERDDHSEWGAVLMGNVIRDLKHTVRMLVKSPLFTVTAIVTLALGIGLNAATFSAVSGILLRPLDGTQEPDRLVQIYRTWAGIEYGSNSYPHYRDLRDRTGDAFESLAAHRFTTFSLSADDRSERLMGLMVSANFFQTYGTTPALGRAFMPEEDTGPGSHPVAILGHGFWQSRFGGDPGVVGRTVTLNGHTFEIVGVAAADFKGPVNFASIPLYAPLMMQNELVPGFSRLDARGENSLSVVGRLREGATVEHAQRVVDATVSGLAEEYPNHYEEQLGTTLVLQSEAGIHPMFRSAQVGMSTVMMAVVALLLLIACVNVANLFLARARDRRQEMGIRLSLGSGTGRIVQQLLTESLVFSVLAGLAGLGLARVALGFLRRVRPPVDGPWEFSLEMDIPVLLFTLGISLGAGLLFGLVPALQAARPDTVAAVKGESSRRGGPSRMSGALVVLQMALSLLLLISSGLFLRSLQGATQIDPGFDEPAGLVTASVDPGLQGYDEAASREFLDRLMERTLALPEVGAVGMTNIMPLGLSSSDRGVEIPGYEFAPDEPNSLKYAMISEGYLEAMGIDLVEGRTFNRQDDAEGTPVIIVNRRFAERFWPGESALGKVVITARQERTVVGVAETGKYVSLGEEPTAFMYFPHRELFVSGMSLVARAADPQRALGGIRAVVRDMDADMPIFDVRTVADHMGVVLLPALLGGTVLGLFGVLGLVLAAVGIYGVMAYSVSRRTRELGIRVALGADPRRVVRLVLREGMTLALVGTVLGLAGAAGAARLVEGLLYNVSALDPVAFVGVPAVLVAVAALAVWIPARRAASVEPMRALRME
ncbi:MAG TPA: ABC transporter permease [Longimicrobiales bacterium]|jgi:predicted permease